MRKDLEILIEEAKASIVDAYLSGSAQKLYNGYSGGKDSSVTLSLTVQAIESLDPSLRTEPIYVLFSDTLLEMPPVISQIQNGIERFKEYVKENNLPFIFQQVHPTKVSNHFWGKVIGAGDPIPRKDSRWCTDLLKIQPMQTEVNKILNLGGYIAITGSRKDESADRKERLERNAISPGSKMKKHSDSRCNVLCPIEDWSQDDVWEYIYNGAGAWVDKHGLGRVYSEAAGDGDECTTILEGGDGASKPGCSKSARYGCWMCPLFDKDKTLGNLAKGHEYLVHMENFRNWLVTFRDGKWDSVRDVFNHRDQKRLSYSYDNQRFGTTSPGGYTLEFRKEILTRLLETEAKVRETTDLFLLSDEELVYIQERWVKDGDISFECVAIAKQFGRSVSVSKELAVLAESAQLMYALKFSTYWDKMLPAAFGIYANERFCAQFIMEKFGVAAKKQKNTRKFNYEDSMNQISHYLFGLVESSSAADIVTADLVEMKMKKQFYPSDDLERMIRREWEQDKPSYATALLVSEHNGTPAEHEKEEGYDWLEDDGISLQDKIDMLDNWSYYSDGDKEDNAVQQKFPGEFNSVKVGAKSTTAKASKKTSSAAVLVVTEPKKRGRPRKIKPAEDAAPISYIMFGNQMAINFDVMGNI